MLNLTLALNLIVYSVVAFIIGYVVTATPVATWWVKKMMHYMVKPIEEEGLIIGEEFEKLYQKEDEN